MLNLKLKPYSLEAKNVVSKPPAFRLGEVSFLEVVISLKQVIHKAVVAVVVAYDNTLKLSLKRLTAFAELSKKRTHVLMVSLLLLSTTTRKSSPIISSVHG